MYSFKSHTIISPEKSAQAMYFLSLETSNVKTGLVWRKLYIDLSRFHSVTTPEKEDEIYFPNEGETIPVIKDKLSLLLVFSPLNT